MAQGPSHHKANSMQISSKYKAKQIQMHQGQMSQNLNTINSHNNAPQTHQIQQSSSQTNIQMPDIQKSQIKNANLNSQSMALRAGQLQNNTISPSVKIPPNSNKQQKVMILQNAAEQHIKNQNKLVSNPHIVMNQQHVKIKSMQKQMAASSNGSQNKYVAQEQYMLNQVSGPSENAMVSSPNQDGPKGPKVQQKGGIVELQKTQLQQNNLISHKKANSLMNQKNLYDLLMDNNNQEKASQNQGSDLRDPINQKILQSQQIVGPSQAQSDIEGFTIGGPNSKTLNQPQLQGPNHGKSKSFIHNNEFVSVSADNSQINNPNMNNLIKQQQIQMQIPTIQNIGSKQHKKIVGSQMAVNDADQSDNRSNKAVSSNKMYKQYQNISQKHNLKRASEKTKKPAMPTAAGVSGAMSMKGKIISNSFDKTAGGGYHLINNHMQVIVGNTLVNDGQSKLQQQIQTQNRANKLGQKQKSFHYNQNTEPPLNDNSQQEAPTLFSIAGGHYAKKAKQGFAHGPGQNIHTAGIPTHLGSGMVTKGHVSGHQSIITSSTSNLHANVQKPKPQQPSHHRTKSDANYIQNLHAQNIQIAQQDTIQTSQMFNPQKTGGVKSNYIISSSNHVYPQQPAKTQGKKASNLKSMSSNNQISQVSSQGATKGLLKFSNYPQQQQTAVQNKNNQKVQNKSKARAGPIMQGKTNQPLGHKKNQYSTMTRSKYKNLIGNQNDQSFNDPNMVMYNDGASNSTNKNPSITRAGNNQQKPGTAGPMGVDLEVFNSSQNKTTEQKYAELKTKYNDLLSKHFALAAQKTEDNRYSNPQYQYGGQQSEAGGNKGSISGNVGGNQQLISSFQVQPKFPQSQQQTLEPPQIIIMDKAVSSRRLENPSGSFVSRGDGNLDGSRGSSQNRQMKNFGQMNNIRYSQELYNDNIIVQNFDEHPDIHGSDMINYGDDQDSEGIDGIGTMNANSDAEAELNMIIGSQNVSQNQTPRDLSQREGDISQQKSNQNSIYINGKTDGASAPSNITQNNGILINSNIYHINLNQGSSSIGNTIISRIEGQGQYLNGPSSHTEEVAKNMSNRELSSQNAGRKASLMGTESFQQPHKTQQGRIPITHHKRSVSDGGIFNNMGLKAKAAQVQSQNSGSNYTGHPVVQQQQIPLKQQSQQASQSLSFEQKVHEMRELNGLEKSNKRQEQQQKQNQMLILEEDENQDRTVTQNSNEENVHTEMDQEYDRAMKNNNMNTSSNQRIMNQMNDGLKVNKVAQAYIPNKGYGKKGSTSNAAQQNVRAIENQKQPIKKAQSKSQPRRKDLLNNQGKLKENNSSMAPYNDNEAQKSGRERAKVPGQKSGNFPTTPNSNLKIDMDTMYQEDYARFQNSGSQEPFGTILNEDNVQLLDSSINDIGPDMNYDGNPIAPNCTGTAGSSVNNAFQPIPCGPNNKKVINVSFNDFNQSISNDYDENAPGDILDEKSNKSHRSKGSAPDKYDEHSQSLNNIGSIQTSNKNLNSFLEALQKIRPLNPVQNNNKNDQQYGSPSKQANAEDQSSFGAKQKQNMQHNIETHKLYDKAPQGKHKKIKSEILQQNQGQGLEPYPLNNVDNTSANNGRFEKYHKMMQKVKQNDKTMSSKNSKIIQPGKKVIKTNQQPLNLRSTIEPEGNVPGNQNQGQRKIISKHNRIKSTNDGILTASGDQLVLSQMYKYGNPKQQMKVHQQQKQNDDEDAGAQGPMQSPIAVMRQGNNSLDFQNNNQKQNLNTVASPINQKNSGRGEGPNGTIGTGGIEVKPKVLGGKHQKNVSHGIPVSGLNDQESNKDLKITLIGDQSLLMQQHQKNKIKSQKGTNKKATFLPQEGKSAGQYYLQQQQPKQGSHFMNYIQNQVGFGGSSPFNINSASGSNTGGQPSPIISTKRVPQKILAQTGDSSLSPSGPSSIAGNYSKQRDKLSSNQGKPISVMKKQQIQQNNFISGGEDYNQLPDKFQKYRERQGKNHNPSVGLIKQINKIEFNEPTNQCATPQVLDDTIEEDSHFRQQLGKFSQKQHSDKQQQIMNNVRNAHHDFFNQHNRDEVQVISDLDDTSPHNISPMSNSQKQIINNQESISENDKNVRMIQNLNKQNFFNIDESADAIGDENNGLLPGGQQQHIHIIQHPMPSGSGSKKKRQFQAPVQLLGLPQAPQVSERLVTDESYNDKQGNGGELTPRSRKIRKLIKMVKLSFRKQQTAPDTTIDFYRIGKILGKGAFGKVNLAVHILTQQLCAVKSINKQCFSNKSDESESTFKKIMQEVVMLKRTRHKNIVRLYEYFETEKHILFVIELCAGGDLLNYVRRRRRLKEDVAKCLFKQIIESLAYCHSKNIVHRDIKLDNILLDYNGRVKICDFGVGKIVKKGEKMVEQCGTPAYIAPEILKDEGYYGFAVDIWSAGVALYAMLYGTVPFKANNMSELQKIIMKAKYTLKEDISIESREMLKGLLEKDPAKRLTIGAILNHPWLIDAPEAEDVELFTEQEVQYIKSEFCYNKSSRYARNKEMAGLAPMKGADGVDPQDFESLPSELDKDMFTEHMLDSTQNSILKNAETKSVILAPFNSTKSNLDEQNEEGKVMELSDSIKELIEDRRIIKFGPRVRDIDKQYEINNNADLDNGVYHKYDEEEEEGQPQDNEQDNKSDEESENDPEENKDQVDLDPEEQEILQQLKKKEKKKKAGENGKSKNKQSELERLENMIQDEEKLLEPSDLQIDYNALGGNPVTENSQNDEDMKQFIQIPDNRILNSSPDDVGIHLPQSPKNQQNENIKIIEGTEESIESYRGPGATPNHHNSNQHQLLEQTMAQLTAQQLRDENMALEENLVQQVVEFGYPREYIIKCLDNRDLNYATTSYLLMHFAKRARPSMMSQ